MCRGAETGGGTWGRQRTERIGAGGAVGPAPDIHLCFVTSSQSMGFEASEEEMLVGAPGEKLQVVSWSSG